MTNYVCKKCNTIFDRKYNYDRHCNRVTSCVVGSKTRKQNSFKCRHCKKSFNRKDNMIRHSNICKLNINGDNNGNKKNKNTVAGNNNIIAGKKAVVGNHNVITHNDVTHNKYYFFFGKDGVKSMSQDDIINLLKSDKNLIEYLISNINLDPKKPKHHNVYYADTKSTYGEIYHEDNKWVKMKIDQILNTLMDAKIEDLNGILQNIDGIVNKSTKNKVKNAIQDLDIKQTSARKKLISYLKPILYNNKDMILKTREKNKKQIITDNGSDGENYSESE